MDPNRGNPIFAAQTSILAWIRRNGGAVDFRSEERYREPVARLLPLAGYHGLPCSYCTKPMLLGTGSEPTREHIIPRSAGGTLAPRNRLIVCRPCNNDKDDLSLEEFAKKLTRALDPRAFIVWKLFDARGATD